jgi:hypothetical protein
LLDGETYCPLVSNLTRSVGMIDSGRDARGGEPCDWPVVGKTAVPVAARPDLSVSDTAPGSASSVALGEFTGARRVAPVLAPTD